MWFIIYLSPILVVDASFSLSSRHRHLCRWDPIGARLRELMSRSSSDVSFNVTGLPDETNGAFGKNMAGETTVFGRILRERGPTLINATIHQRWHSNLIVGWVCFLFRRFESVSLFPSNIVIIDSNKRAKIIYPAVANEWAIQSKAPKHKIASCQVAISFTESPYKSLELNANGSGVQSIFIIISDVVLSVFVFQ